MNFDEAGDGDVSELPFVLVVDKNKIAGELLSEELTQQGHRVLVAAACSDAVAVLEKDLGGCSSKEPGDIDLSAMPFRAAKERALEAFEERYFSAILTRTGGNVSEAARQAGLDRSNFRRALRRAKSRANCNEEGAADNSHPAATPRPIVRTTGVPSPWVQENEEGEPAAMKNATSEFAASR